MRHVAVMLMMFMLVGVASAATTFEIGNGSSISLFKETADDGLNMTETLEPGLDAILFSLNVGESYSFDFATVDTTEVKVNDDDIVPQAGSAMIDFDGPVNANVQLTGTTVGVRDGAFPWQDGTQYETQGWELVWDTPILVNFGVGGQFRVELSDTSHINTGLATLIAGPRGTETVVATVTLLAEEDSDPGQEEPIPAPGALLLASLGGIGVNWMRRRRSL